MEAPDRVIGEVAGGQTLGHIGEEGRQLGIHAGGAEFGGRRLDIFGSALLDYAQPRFHLVGSKAVAAGTISLRIRAPWLPPVTRIDSGLSCVGAA